jgi:DNA-binding HxlR family transcriptional regulator
VRAGTHALSLLSVPLNVDVLRTLEEEPKSLVDLRRAIGSPPQTTMRKQLRVLTEIGLLDRHRQSEFPAAVRYELRPAGRRIMKVAEVLQMWLEKSPEGPIPLGSTAAKSVIRTLVEGWSSTIVRALAARPLSLTDLNRLISTLNYPSLERRLGDLRYAGLIEPCPGQGRATPYAASTWLRRAVGPLATAARWEQAHLSSYATPIGRLDVEAAFLLVVPLITISSELSGRCRLAVVARKGGKTDVAGVSVTIEEGRVVSCVARLHGEMTAWASGSSTSWIAAVIERDPRRLEVRGDSVAVSALLHGLFGALTGEPQQV